MRARSAMPEALWPGVFLCVVAAVMAFTLSFTALRAVGIASGISPRLAWMFPLTIDTVILFGTWAAFRFRARGAAGTWYAWVLLIFFAAASWIGNFLHAEPVPVGHMSLSRPVASLFSSVPSLSLLLTTHMLVLIAVRRGDEREQRRADEPTRVVDVGEEHLTPDKRTQIAPPTHAPTTPDLASWVAARIPVGLPVRGTDVVDAGLANSPATARRRLATLRQSDPTLFGGTA